jgi:hypothetical protein
MLVAAEAQMSFVMNEVVHEQRQPGQLGFLNALLAARRTYAR